MTKPKKQSNQIGWQFDNSYTTLPDHFFQALPPETVTNPRTAIVNYALAETLDLSLGAQLEDDLAQIFSGNILPQGAQPIAQAYAGHQFGHFNMLGDGRAHLLGEHITPSGQRVDIQLKGSGRTPYSRRGDGRAALGPMLREYIISEAMHALAVPTTRSLAVVTTGEPIMRETLLQGAILTRIAKSHLRVGTFEYVAAKEDAEGIKTLADYAIDRHYPELKSSDAPYLEFLKAVMNNQIKLVTQWLRVGFIHGVMNTDNVTISGETIDYGPCAFMDSYHPDTVFSSIDHNKRYAFANQAHIAQWNLARLAGTLLPLLHNNFDKAVILAEETIASFGNIFQTEWLAMMRQKIGLFGEEKEDTKLIGDLLQWMQENEQDYTNTFRILITENLPKESIFQTEDFKNWWSRWQERLARNIKPLKSSFCLMRASNPAIIPRNHQVEAALLAAQQDCNFTKLHTLLEALKNPYAENAEFAAFKSPATPQERVLATFCGT